jgi:hypothetical protein
LVHAVIHKALADAQRKGSVIRNVAGLADPPKLSAGARPKMKAWEADELRRFLGSQENAVVVCGDRHWQYLSVDPDTEVREYSCGPASESHAGGWRPGDFVASHHRFLEVGGGFLFRESLNNTAQQVVREMIGDLTAAMEAR